MGASRLPPLPPLSVESSARELRWEVQDAQPYGWLVVEVGGPEVRRVALVEARRDADAIATLPLFVQVVKRLWRAGAPTGAQLLEVLTQGGLL